jgi:hypothetical protein
MMARIIALMSAVPGSSHIWHQLMQELADAVFWVSERHTETLYMPRLLREEQTEQFLAEEERKRVIQERNQTTLANKVLGSVVPQLDTASLEEKLNKDIQNVQAEAEAEQKQLQAQKKAQLAFRAQLKGPVMTDLSALPEDLEPHFFRVQQFLDEQAWIKERILSFRKRYNLLQQHEGKNKFVLNTVVMRWQQLAVRYAFINWRARVRLFKRQHAARRLWIDRQYALRAKAKMRLCFRAWRMVRPMTSRNVMRPLVENEVDKHGLLTSSSQKQISLAKAQLQKVQKLLAVETLQAERNAVLAAALEKLNARVAELRQTSGVHDMAENCVKLARCLLDKLETECSYAQEFYVFDATRLLADHRFGSVFSEKSNRPFFFADILLKLDPQALLLP